MFFYKFIKCSVKKNLISTSSIFLPSISCRTIVCPQFLSHHRLSSVLVAPSFVLSSCRTIVCPQLLSHHRLSSVLVALSFVLSSCSTIVCPLYNRYFANSIQVCVFNYKFQCQLKMQLNVRTCCHSCVFFCVIYVNCDTTYCT